MPAKTPTQSERDREEVLRLKRTMNPATGLPYTYPEISAILGYKSGMSAFRMVPKPLRDGACPTCLQILSQENEN